MASSGGFYEDVADELAQWIEDISDFLADALSDGSHSPFAADVTEADKLAYYRSKLFNPDGSPNVQERQALLDRAGVQGYVKVMQALGKQKPGIPDHPFQAQIADNEIGNGES